MECRQEETVPKQRSTAKEKGDLVRKYNATHEEKFLSSWLRENTKGKAEEAEEMRKRPKEDVSVQHICAVVVMQMCQMMQFRL